MFVWVFHRVSGVLLIVLLGLKFFSGFGLGEHFGPEAVESFRTLHNTKVLELLLLFLFVFHSAYGIRTILFDLGVKKEKQLFWGATIVGAVVFVVLGLMFYFNS